MRNCDLHRGVILTLCAVIMAAVPASALAQLRSAVPVPNGSFESPVLTTIADPQLALWQKTPKPDWYVEDPESGQIWDILVGVFQNVVPTNSVAIDNVDGNQALYLFSVPEAGLFQDYNSVAGTNGTPTQAFDARFEVGKSYDLTAGVLGGGPISEGATLQVRLYYRAGGTNLVTVAATNVVYTAASFPSKTHLEDVRVHVPEVKATDPWAGQYVGVQFISTVAPEVAGGYWDIDNVRLTKTGGVPNGSFESPVLSTVADPRFDRWQKNPKPDWYVEDPESGQIWDILVGIFQNVVPTNSVAIDNVDGTQALYLFSVPEAGLFQDFISVSGTNGTPDQMFDARFEVGRAYDLTVGLLGGGPINEGASLQARVYYRPSATNLVTVAATNIVYTVAAFPSKTHLIDYTVHVPEVKASDPWAGQYIGVQFVSTVAPEAAGGYWDLDNVRLTAAGPALRLERSGSEIRLAWASTTGSQYQLQRSADLKAWGPFEGALAGTGAELTKTIPISIGTNSLFRLLVTQLP